MIYVNTVRMMMMITPYYDTTLYQHGMICVVVVVTDGSVCGSLNGWYRVLHGMILWRGLGRVGGEKVKVVFCQNFRRWFIFYMIPYLAL